MRLRLSERKSDSGKDSGRMSGRKGEEKHALREELPTPWIVQVL